jgi:hypothetical protein
MTWAKLDDRFPEHPKVVGLSDKAFRLYVSGICYSSANTTDGEIPRAALLRLGGTPKLAAELVAAALWDTTSRDGWAVHDYLVYNRSKVTIESTSDSRRKAGSKGLAKRWQNASQNDGNVPLSVSASVEELCSSLGEPPDTERQNASKLPRHKPLDEEYLNELAEEFPTVKVRDVLQRAMNRKTWDGYKDKRRALREYVGYDLERQKGNGNGRMGTGTNANGRGSSPQDDPELKRLRALGVIAE